MDSFELEDISIIKIIDIQPESEISGYNVIQRLLFSPLFLLQPDPQNNLEYQTRLDFAHHSLESLAQVSLESLERNQDITDFVEELKSFIAKKK